MSRVEKANGVKRAPIETEAAFVLLLALTFLTPLRSMPGLQFVAGASVLAPAWFVAQYLGDKFGR